jgi:N-methylhydantoinase B
MNLEEKAVEVDPITLSVVWNRLLTITRECGERVVHSSQSFVMAQARDLGPVLLTPQAEIVTTVEFLPCHCLLAEIPTSNILKKSGKLNKGDMVIGNDGFIVQSGHLPDWTFLVPIYYRDELVYYCHFRAHMADSGGALSGSYFPRAYDCIAEGLNIPPIKIIERGEVDQKLREVLFDNIRTPAAVWSDNKLIYGSIQRMENDICELIEKYGLNTLKDCTREIIKRDEMATRKQIAAIPDGVYHGESACDWDGSVPDRPVWVRVKLRVEGDEMTFDFSDSDDQVDFINSPLGNTYAFTYLAIFLHINPTIPHNHGSRVPVHIIAPEGKVVNPIRPHTYGACACSCACAIYEACAMALGQADPENAKACSARHFSVDFAGRLPIRDPRTGQDLEYFGAPFIEEGGTGAVKGFDGWDGETGSIHSGALKRGSVEENELAFPFLWSVVECEKDSEGAGEFVGGRGTYSERWCVAPKGAKTVLMAGDCDGSVHAPPGMAGAPPTFLGKIFIRREGSVKREVFRTLDMAEMYPGDLLITHAPGGAGWGYPLNRNPEKVRKNVQDGLVSINRARDVYGVLFKAHNMKDPSALEIDDEGTEKLRKEMKTKKSRHRGKAIRKSKRRVSGNP